MNGYCWKCGREGSGGFCQYDGAVLEEHRPAPTEGYEHMWAVPAPKPMTQEDYQRMANQPPLNAKR